MTVRSMRSLVCGLALLGLVSSPTGLQAQECEGSEPKGGRWATSGELYLDRANKNPDLEDKMKLFNQALEVLTEGFQAQPDNPRNYKLAGEAYAGLNDYVGADSVWARAEQMWSCYAGTIDTLRHRTWVRAFNSGVRYFQNGDLAKAETSYKDAWAVYKRLPQPMLQLGSLYAQQAVTAQSIEEQKEFQERSILAYQEALAALERAGERLNEEQRQTYGRATAFNLAQLFALGERFLEAAAAYQKFLMQEPDNIDAMQNAAVVITRAAQQSAQEAAELEAGPSKDALLAKADSLERVAEGLYTKLLARDDLEARDYHNIGLGFSNMGGEDRAITAFGKALDLQPYRENSLEQLAMAYFSSQKYDSLLPVAQKLVERYPLNMNNLALLANGYREANDTQNALTTLERREALSVEVTDLELEAKEGAYEITGFLHNIKHEAGGKIELKFDLYNDVGELVTSATATLTVPEQGNRTRLSVTAESAAQISGFTYQQTGTGKQQAGT